MTDFNKHNPYPDIATIRCPRCESRAEFRKAFSLIGTRSWAWWASRLWPSSRATNWDAQKRWVAGDPPPDWRGWIVIEHDPGLFQWKQPSGGYRRGSDEGIVMCSHCVGRRKHILRWPSDAYYRFDLPQGLLWAWNREGAEALVEFIASTKRDPAAHGHYLFLRHIPSVFLAAKRRESIIKLLRRELAKDPV